MWTNKQHIMSRLGREHEVYYVNFESLRIKAVLRDAARTRSITRLLELGFRPARQERDNVTILEFFSPELCEGYRHGNPLRVFGQFDLRVRLIGRFLERARIDDAIIWVYHPGYGDRVAKLPHKLLVYDCVDEYTAFPEFSHAKPWIAGRERKLLAAADLVFCTAATLYEAKRDANPHTHLVHNVGDAEHFGKALDPNLGVPDDLARLPRPIVGFVGAVSDYKLNSEWLVHLARERPEWSVVVIGPTGIGDPGSDVSALRATPNVHLMGHRAYAELPAYLKGFDVAVIPYRINDYTRGVFPIKFFEFLATGKPVVISDLPAVSDYHHLVGVARTAEEFVERCQSALADGASGQAERLAAARKNSWSSRVDKLMSLVNERLAARARAQR
jgi:glycosyltransferase involved in cell wall biosynthesis